MSEKQKWNDIPAVERGAYLMAFAASMAYARADAMRDIHTGRPDLANLSDLGVSASHAVAEALSGRSAEWRLLQPWIWDVEITFRRDQSSKSAQTAEMMRLTDAPAHEIKRAELWAKLHEAAADRLEELRW